MWIICAKISQEIREYVLEVNTSHRFRNRLEDFEVLFSILFYLHDRRHVAAPVAVVGSAPDSDQVLILEPVDIPFLHELMGPSDQLQPIDMAKVIGDLRSEDPASSSCVDGPIFDILGVRPHQIAEWPLVRDLDLAVDGPNLIDGLDLRRQPAMNAEDLA